MKNNHYFNLTTQNHLYKYFCKVNFLKLRNQFLNNSLLKIKIVTIIGTFDQEFPTISGFLIEN